MNRKIRNMIASTLALALIGSLAFAQADLTEIQESGSIRIATANEIPYGWIDENGDARGIGPDVAEAVLANMGVTDIDWTVTEFGSLIPGLIADRFDMVAASQAVLPARCEQVDFSIINSSYGEGLLVEAGNPQDIHGYEDFVDNSNLTMGIVSGADQLDFAQAYGLRQNQIVSIPSNTDALSAVATGRVDAYAATGLTVGRLALNSEDVEAAEPFTDPVVDGEPVRSFGAFTLNADSDEFREAFNEELGAFQETQEYRDILLSHGLTEQDIDAALAVTTEELCSGEG
ncbi:MAG: ectoine/hydroxyectoine ABC transporter substrate-binding protein EhuB [Trueperaceae bacterium]